MNNFTLKIVVRRSSIFLSYFYVTLRYTTFHNNHIYFETELKCNLWMQSRFSRAACMQRAIFAHTNFEWLKVKFYGIANKCWFIYRRFEKFIPIHSIFLFTLQYCYTRTRCRRVLYVYNTMLKSLSKGPFINYRFSPTFVLRKMLSWYARGEIEQICV